MLNAQVVRDVRGGNINMPYSTVKWTQLLVIGNKKGPILAYRMVDRKGRSGSGFE
jgi:hypothetical protein